MNKFIVCSIRDKKADYFLLPQFHKNADVAIRAFAGACKAGDTSNPMCFASSDFELVQLAEYDTETAAFIPCDHVTLCDGGSL